ncbi:hypothetical protein LOTGIDRAFT_123018 [Lottia gigantea]|uniref:Chitin-binding type-2 domain-containing protein n=1 Tax=Lottia gigantea TaxID=225164 RepID=V3ZHB3_LOTGI|nr:hypothetical protein LOTGIDRAFT_123018 [Lottia gigantea]ESO90648.1 hypothetical protein LOTGIDRAFT_123018 [Lottia gigantea]
MHACLAKITKLYNLYLIRHIVLHSECINSCSVGTALGIYAICGSCVDYVTCIGATAIPQTCTGGLIFDAVSGSCNTVERAPAECTEDCVGVSAAGLFPKCQDCSRWFICAQNVASEQICAPGLYFDITSQTCALATQTTCG